MFTAEDLIHSYTRQQAIEDGFLVDLTDKAAGYGFRIPFIVTAEAMALITPTERETDLGQSFAARLHNLLFVAGISVRTQKRSVPTDRIAFNCGFLLARGGKPTKQETVTFKLVCGPGDNTEPVLTLQLLHES